jgi:hypothetical protein
MSALNDKTSIEINASGEMFNANINVDVNLGWKIVTNSQVELRQDTVPKRKSSK